MAKKVLKIVGGVLGALVLVAVIYVVYVMTSYYRLDDSLSLETASPEEGQGESAIQLNTGSQGRAQEFTIVSANLGFGAYGPDFDFFMDGGSGSVAPSAQYVSANINGSADAIEGLDPDIVLFQEVDIDGTRSHGVDEYALLRNDFPTLCSVFAQNYDSPYLAWPLYAPHGKNKAGMATFSRYQIESTLRRSLPISESFSKFLDLDRCYTISRIAVSDSKELVVFNVHLSAYGADAEVLEGQRAMLFADMQREYEAGNYVIAGGDFNHDMIGVSNEVYGNVTDTEASWAKPFDFASVPEGFVVAAKSEFDAGTFDSCIEQRTLDLDFAFSDHNPVYLRFSFK